MPLFHGGCCHQGFVSQRPRQTRLCEISKSLITSLSNISVNRILLPVVSALVVTCLLASCASDPSNPGASFAFVKAKVGSTYTFDYFETDSTGAVIPGSRDTSVSIIIATGETFGGKVNVSVFDGNVGGPSDSGRFACETNNDVSLPLRVVKQGQTWITIPISSTAPQTSDAADTFGVGSSATIERQIVTATREGEEIMVIDGQSIATVKIKARLRWIVVENGVQTEDESSDLYLNWAPSLGFFTRLQEAAKYNSSGRWSSGREQTLLSFVLK